MRVVWTDRAKARLHQIHTCIAQDHPINAERMVDRLTCRVAQLAEHPRSGRCVEKYQREDLRELIEAPYRIVYLILSDRIDIVTVRDTRRVLPRRLDALWRATPESASRCGSTALEPTPASYTAIGSDEQQKPHQHAPASPLPAIHGSPSPATLPLPLSSSHESRSVIALIKFSPTQAGIVLPLKPFAAAQ